MRWWLSARWTLAFAATTLPTFGQEAPQQPQAQPAPPPEQPVDLTQQGAQSSPPAATQPPAAPQSAPQQSAPPPGYGAPPPGYAPPPPGYPGAYEPPPPPPPPKPEPRTVSLTFSPLHLILPVFEMMGEFRPVNGLGLAGIFGYGKITFPVDEFDPTTGVVQERDVTATVLELGLQTVWYPLDAFDSLQVGAEFVWLSAEANEVSQSSNAAVAVGVAVGPFVGYKLITSGGFTFLVQGGAQYVFARAEPEAPSGTTTTTDEATAVIVLLNLNIGWSF
jgi:hypothetical protein